MRGIEAAIQALAALLASGGGVVIVVVLVLCLVGAILASPLGIFFSFLGGNSGGQQQTTTTISAVVQELDQDYDARLGEMLDALLDGSIALCDAGTGIGKTYAYLAAGAVFLRFHTNGRHTFRPIIISTSSIALQNTVQTEYLPTLSAALVEGGMVDQPLHAVVRKGKSHYVCDRRLEQRLGQLDLSRKNWRAGRALLSLREQLDMDTAAHLCSFDRDRVCIPQTCADCGRENCR